MKRLWEEGTAGRILGLDKLTLDAVTSVSFSPDSKQLASGLQNGTVIVWVGSVDGTVCLYGTATRGRVGRLEEYDSERRSQSWEISMGKTDRIVKHNSGVVTVVAFSPNSMYLASGSWDKMIRLWSVDGTGDLVQILEGKSDGIHALAFSPDGRQLTSGSVDNRRMDGRVRLWDLEIM